MSFQETYFLDDDLNLTTKKSPKKKKVKTIKKIKKLSPKKDNWKINFKSYQETTEEKAAIPIPAVPVPVVPVFKSKKSKKNVSLQVQANGYLLGEEGLELECKYCRPYMQFNSLINFVCHMLKEHENGYIFKCTTCNEQFTGSTIASHLRDHTKTTVSLFFAPCEEHSWYNSEPTEGVDDSRDSSDNEVLTKVKLEYESADANTEEFFERGIEEENAEEGEEIFVGPRSFQRVILNSRKFYVEKRVDDGRFICRNCNITFESILNAMQHMVHDHKGEDPPYTIKTLPKNVEPETNDTTFPTPTTADADELSKPVDNLLCSECGKEFKRSTDLKKHLRVHTGEKPFKCTLCDKDFSTNSGLNRHTLIHTGEKPYLCNTCGKAFNHHGTLKDHSMQHLTDKFDCKFCGKQYTTLTYLRVHLRGAHSREMGKTDQKGYGPFICDVCNKELSSSVSLNIHMRIHTKERPFQCSLCPKNFSHRGTFNHHMQEHLGDKPYKCSECGIGFNFEKKLTEHMRKHTGEKPFQCQLCDKAFRSMSTLCNHRKYDHFGAVKPVYKYKQTFRCEVCVEKFDSKSQLRDHMNLHTDARKYCCSFCTKSYKMRSSLRTHVATKHAVEINMTDFTRKRGPTEARKDLGSYQYLIGHSRQVNR